VKRGLIVRAQSGFYNVRTTDGLLVCHLRGRLKRGRQAVTIAAVGDWVKVSRLDDETGVIESIEPRQQKLSRMDPTPRGEYEQVIVANPDQVVLVFACSQPQPRFGMLDRFLVITEKQAIPALIVANKIDLVTKTEAKELFDHYTRIGYPLVYTSAKTGEGVEEMALSLKDKLSVLVGPSGAGKSSLLNTMQPGLGLAVSKVSQATNKGKHTTVVRELFALEEGGYVADTPGLRALALWDIEPEELDGYFPEMRDLVSQCEYNDCMHIDEPNCAIRRAEIEGRIHPERYHSYVKMRLGGD
jgi:ribosome biogenesis GTPase